MAELKVDEYTERVSGHEGERKAPFLKMLFSFSDAADRALVAVGAAAAAGSGMVLPVMIWFFGDMMNASGGIAGDDRIAVPRVSKVAVKFACLGAAGAAASFLQVACWSITSERQAARIRHLYLKSILRQDMTFFDQEVSTGEVVERISGDVLIVQSALGEKAGQFIQYATSFLGGFAMAFVRGWQVSLVMTATIPLVGISATAMANVISKMAVRGQESYSEAAVVVDRTVGAIRTVASFGGEEQAMDKYNAALRIACKASAMEGLATGLGHGSTYALVYLGYALGAWFGSKMILHAGYDGGEVISTIALILLGSMSLGQAMPSIGTFAAGQAAAFKILEAVNRTPEIDVYDTTGRTIVGIEGYIELRDVWFSYPSRPNESVLAGLSLNITSGQRVALVGESGSGKSTVISLIQRFYDPQEGGVFIDGVDIKDLNLRWIRGKIGLVSQEPILFSSSIRDNIAYGKKDATDEEIQAAAEFANVSVFVKSFPKGFDTMVGAIGVQLSGGQKQRVAIARAILKDPRILLLDEATSALDAESEEIVQGSIDIASKDRTTIIVAHRLHTVINADIITVIDQGSISEHGSHAELIAKPNGVYFRLSKLQEMNHDSNGAPLSSGKCESEIASTPPRHLVSIDEHREIMTFFSPLSETLGAVFSPPLNVALDSINKTNMKNATIEQQLQGSKYKEVPLKRLAFLNKQELPVLFLGVLAAVISGVIMPLFGIIFAGVIKTFFEPESKLSSDTKFWSLMFVALGLVTSIAFPAKYYCFAIAGSKLIERIRSMIFNKVVHMEMAWFDDTMNSTGAIGTRLSANAAAVRGLVGDALSLAVQNATTLIAALFLAFFSCWQLALIILALVPLMGLNGWLEMKMSKGVNYDAKMMHEEAGQIASDAVRNIRTVASFCAEEEVLGLYKMKCSSSKHSNIQKGLVTGIGSGIAILLLNCGYATSFLAGAWLMDVGKATFAEVLYVFFALYMAAIGVSQSGGFIPDAGKAKLAVASVFSILDRKSEIDSSESDGITLEVVEGSIELQNVAFRYPTRPGVEVFRDLSFAVKSGKTVALVGESGSGKSTAISLLQRFYNPDSGRILLDGVEIQKFQLSWFRKQMGMVGQEPILFNDSIRANIAYGKGGRAADSEIVAAAKLANAHHFISSLEQGYNTPVGEQGVLLSGGQKQRIAIARAVVREPKILLLDEATSALDAESERAVQGALDRASAKRTTVVVAHRLSTISGADLILVIKNGEVTEQGSHEALMNMEGGAYAAMVACHSSSLVHNK